jgi:hypothetical protein
VIPRTQSHFCSSYQCHIAWGKTASGIKETFSGQIPASTKSLFLDIYIDSHSGANKHIPTVNAYIFLLPTQLPGKLCIHLYHRFQNCTGR